MSFFVGPPYAPTMPRAMGRSKPEPSLHVGRSQIDCDVSRRDVVTAVLQCSADSIPTLSNGCIGEANSMEVVLVGLDPGTIHLDLDDVRVNAVNSRA